MSESSESSEDENIKKLLEAADLELINDSLYSDASGKSKITSHRLPKSQRYLETESLDPKSDIRVPKQMQKFVGKKLSEIISKTIHFVEPDLPSETPELKDDVGGVKLFSDATDYIKIQDEPTESVPQPKPKFKKSRKHKMEEELNVTTPGNMAVDPELILSKKETQSWTNRPNNKLYRYKEKKAKLYLTDEDTEFTAARKKNNWDEVKIKKSIKLKK